MSVQLSKQVFVAKSAPAAGTAASASQAAGAAGVSHVCTGIAFGFSAHTALGGATTVTVNLRDGAAGAGTVLATWQFNLAAAAVLPVWENMTDLEIRGTPATAMTLEFSANVGNLLSYCTLIGYDDT